MEFQLDLFAVEISYSRICSSILALPFKGVMMKLICLPEFYSCGQKAKESEEAFTDELQILARKVISKKPDFHINLDSTLKQRYASQLYYHSNASIAKTLLIQMLKVFFYPVLQWVGLSFGYLPVSCCTKVSTKASISLICWGWVWGRGSAF